jgi:hypothetical protein
MAHEVLEGDDLADQERGVAVAVASSSPGVLEAVSATTLSTMNVAQPSQQPPRCRGSSCIRVGARVSGILGKGAGFSLSTGSLRAAGMRPGQGGGEGEGVVARWGVTP